jgi:hypothetical protein
MNATSVLISKVYPLVPKVYFFSREQALNVINGCSSKVHF